MSLEQCKVPLETRYLEVVQIIDFRFEGLIVSDQKFLECAFDIEIGPMI